MATVIVATAILGTLVLSPFEVRSLLKDALAACAFERCKILDVGLELIPAACLLEIALPLGRV